MKTRVAILEKLNSPLIVDEVEFPTLGCGQVLVRVYTSGICGAQIGEITGAKGDDPYLPHLLGHEGVGIVEDVGIGVSHVKIGDHVVMHWRRGVGIESALPKYKWKDRVIGGGWVTTFNRYAVVSENRLTSINMDIPFDVAALMGCAVTTALVLINNEAQLKIGQSIAIAGCGGVGLNIVQGASMVSANPVIAIDMYQKKLDLAVKLGATHAVNTSDGDSVDTVYDIVGKKGVDVFVDCTGDVALINAGFSTVRSGGRMILVGQPHYLCDLTLSLVRQHYCGKILMDSQGGFTNPTVDIPRYLDLYQAGKLSFDGIVTHRFPLEQINDAIGIVRSGIAGRCMITMEGE